MNFGAGQLILTNQFGEKTFDQVQGVLLTGAGAPVNGTSGSGAKVSPKGGLYLDVTNAALYQNTNTQTSPTWTQVGTLNPVSETVSGAGALSTTKVLSNLANSTGGDFAVTLAAPSSQDGQFKLLKMTVRTSNNVTLAMTNIGIGGGYTARGTTTLTFSAVDHSAVLMALGGKWVYLGGTAVAS